MNNKKGGGERAIVRAISASKWYVKEGEIGVACPLSSTEGYYRILKYRKEWGRELIEAELGVP